MGEEVGVWGGSYAVTKGFYGPFRRRTRARYAHCRGGDYRRGHGAAMVGQRPVAELMTINFAFAPMDHIVNEAAKLALYVCRAVQTSRW